MKGKGTVTEQEGEVAPDNVNDIVKSKAVVEGCSRQGER